MVVDHLEGVWVWISTSSSACERQYYKYSTTSYNHWTCVPWYYYNIAGAKEAPKAASMHLQSTYHNSTLWNMNRVYLPPV